MTDFNTIALVLLDVMRITIASLPWWVVFVLLVGIALAVVAAIGVVLRMIGVAPPRRHRHDHWHHRGVGW